MNMDYVQHGADKFDRTQTTELKRVPFTLEEFEVVPGAVEAIGWVVLAFCFGALFVGFLGL